MGILNSKEEKRKSELITPQRNTNQFLFNFENLLNFQNQSIDELFFIRESIGNDFNQLDEVVVHNISSPLTNNVINSIDNMKLTQSPNRNNELNPLNELKRDLSNSIIDYFPSSYYSFHKKNKRKESDISYSDLEQTNVETLPDSLLLQRKTTIDDIGTSLVTYASKSSISIDRDESQKQLNKEKADKLRQSYMEQLLFKKVWNPKQSENYERKYNSITVFDWDDTLLCTTFLSFDGVYDEDVILTTHSLEKIAQLESLVYRLLSLALDKGDVYIITNSDPDWIDFSSEKYYPKIIPLLNKITIISARGLYENKFPRDNRMWKIQSFLQLKQYYDSDKLTNIISLGDSNIEMEAAHVLGAQFTQSCIKTIKFRETPKIEELNKQLRLVTNQFDEIHSAPKNLSIKIEKKE